MSSETAVTEQVSDDQSEPLYRIGIDIGGTFTDIVLIDEVGAVIALKSPSIPKNPSAGVMLAIEVAAEAVGRSAKELLSVCTLFVHGSTIATNTLLERKGAKVAMLTTDGFRDSLEIRRGLRSDPWDHRTASNLPLVPRRLRRGIEERVDSSGEVLSALNPASVLAAIADVREAGADSVAICFINSHRNAEHEQQCRALVSEAWPGVWVSSSAEIAPVMGEYERGSTAVADAYVAMAVVPYVRELEKRLQALGYERPLLVVQSNGGVLDVEEITRQPVRMALSGPAAGVGALRFYGSDTGSRDLIAIEVGGTSCDVTMMRDGAVAMTDQLDIDGNCITTPSVEIHTVGAGGGTIGHLDFAGMMHAGPQGAGARPGPACYGLGGKKPTVTDAQLVLGRLAPGSYAGGAMNLDADRAVEAIETHLARPLGISVERAAAGLIRLVEQTIQHAVERVSVERGYDLKNFTLVAAGGAGPLHGSSVGRTLGCSAIYVPRLAGVFCAFGMCNADVRLDRVKSWHGWLGTVDEAALSDSFSAIEQSAAEALRRQGFSEAGIEFKRSLSMRYAGQQWPLEIDLEGEFDARKSRHRFQESHRFAFGHHQDDAEIEITHLRVAAIGKLANIEKPAPVRSTGEPVSKGKRQVWIDEEVGRVAASLYDGHLLHPGDEIDGPAIVDETTTTVLVSVGQRLQVTASGNFLIKLKKSAS